jgi:GR25 family glycosyltransferase involved in LPS biosynthesis
MTRFICQAVAARAQIVSYLQRHIPSLEVYWDRSGSNLEGWRMVLGKAGSDPVVLLEDDILLTRNFVAKVKAAIVGRPDTLIQFHSRYKEDVTKGSRWRPGSSFLNNQAVYYPPGMAKAALAFSLSPEMSEYFQAEPTGTDSMLALFLKAQGLRYWNHCPSLAQHLPITSAIDKRRSSARRATTFEDPELEGCPVSVRALGF